MALRGQTRWTARRVAESTERSHHSRSSRQRYLPTVFGWINISKEWVRGHGGRDSVRHAPLCPRTLSDARLTCLERAVEVRSRRAAPCSARSRKLARQGDVPVSANRWRDRPSNRVIAFDLLLGGHVFRESAACRSRFQTSNRARLQAASHSRNRQPLAALLLRRSMAFWRPDQVVRVSSR